MLPGNCCTALIMAKITTLIDGRIVERAFVPHCPQDGMPPETASLYLKIDNLIHDKEHDPNAAAELLKIAAHLFRQNIALPTVLADYLANAFEKASQLKNPESRVNRLASELNLKPRTKMRRHSSILVGEWIEGRMNYTLTETGMAKPLISETTAVNEAAKQFDISKSTAWNYLNEYRVAKNPDYVKPPRQRKG